MEVHSNFKNKWLSNYQEEGEEKRHGACMHTVCGWIYTSQTGVYREKDNTVILLPSILLLPPEG